MESVDLETKVIFLMDSLGLSETQARGLVALARFSSQRAVQTLMAESSSFKIGFGILDVEIFESRGCSEKAFCEKGHPLKAKYWIRLGVDTDSPKDVGVGITCLTHMEELTGPEKRAIATIGRWTVSLAFNELTHLFGTARARADRIPGASRQTGPAVYDNWKSRRDNQDLIRGLPDVIANIDAGATRRKYGAASLTTSCDIARRCEEHQLPCPTVHRRRIMAAHRRLVLKRLVPPLPRPEATPATAHADPGIGMGIGPIPAPGNLPSSQTPVYSLAAA
ncbi:MAG TPA: hypothetical protein VEZ90_16035 [Blastocatellia bacterium]|nr:hypothetical protein [Blastocatellia bacterium]